ncbi:MAG: hypothetical protein Q6K70_07635 [Thermostichales cyanobacterium DRC_bins_46]
MPNPSFGLICQQLPLHLPIGKVPPQGMKCQQGSNQGADGVTLTAQGMQHLLDLIHGVARKLKEIVIEEPRAVKLLLQHQLGELLGGSSAILRQIIRIIALLN